MDSKFALFIKYGLMAYRRPSLPRTVTIDITNKCDLNCRHCNIPDWKGKQDLTYEEITGFFKQIPSVNEVVIGGGEPFLRSDLARICAFLYQNCGTSAISVHTNGNRSEKIVDAVKSIAADCQNAVVSIGISLDGFRETHDRIRTQHSFDNATRTARMIKEIMRDHSNVRLFFSTVIHNENFRELPELAQFVHREFGCTLGYSLIDGTQQDTGLKEPNLEEIEATLDGLYHFRPKSYLYEKYLKVFREVRLKTHMEKRQVIPCHAARVNCLVDSEGNVRFCSRLPSLGNIRTAPFDSIWHGPVSDKLYESIRKGQCYCNDVCALSPSLRNYWKLPLLIAKKILKIH